jgi:hypothetical protein
MLMNTSNVGDGRNIEIEADLHQTLVKASDQTGTTIRRIVQDAIREKVAKLTSGSAR